jgi:magnesium transporter
MARFLKKRRHKAGQSPGAIVFVGERKIETPRLRVMDFDAEGVREAAPEDSSGLAYYSRLSSTSWVNVDGVHDAQLLREMGEAFAIPSLVLEDIANTGQRPVFEAFPDVLFVSLKMLSLAEDALTVRAEQLSAVLTPTCVLTFQERPGTIFEPVRERIRRPSGRLRRLGPTYLLYALLDCVFENALRVVETLGERIEDLEDDVLSDPGPELVETLTTARREMAYVRKAVRPAREVVLRMLRSDSDLIPESVTPYLRDLRDMAEQTVDVVEVYREMLGDHLAAYNMAVANRLNDVMKFLTIFSTIFIPLSFLAGVYGMNFDVMPELHTRYGYFILLGIMGTVAAGMLVYFRYRKWL